MDVLWLVVKPIQKSRPLGILITHFLPQKVAESGFNFPIFQVWDSAAPLAQPRSLSPPREVQTIIHYDDPMILDYQDFFSARWSAHATRNNHQFRSCSRMLPLQRRDFRRKQEGDHLCRGVEEFVEDHTSPGSGRYGQVGQALRSPRLRVKGII